VVIAIVDDCERLAVVGDVPCGGVFSGLAGALLTL